MFPVHSSVLSAEALAEWVLPGYGLLEPCHCRLISRGMNDVYQITAGRETCYLARIGARLALARDRRSPAGPGRRSLRGGTYRGSGPAARG